MSLATFLFYPAESQKTPKDSGQIVARLRAQGVTLAVMDPGGVIVATGPAEWFSDDNREHLRGVAGALGSYLRGEPFVTNGGRELVIPIQTAAFRSDDAAEVQP